MYKTFLICLAIVFYTNGKAQQCTIAGQTPVSATFICSAETFTIQTPEYCGSTTVPTPCADGVLYQNRNPNFFRFGCYAAGTLGFTIVPDNAFSNYSWQLFDITNTNPVDIFTNSGLFVACNWSSEPGETGASSDGINIMECSGSGKPTFSKMPDLLTGRTYLLMVLNESGSAGGYQLSFTGGSAVITDAADPHLLKADLNCERTQITLRLNKQVKCNTLSPDGSDFNISGGVNIISAVPSDCTSQFGTPSVILTLDQPVSIGTYTFTINNGIDNNTLVDICNRSIPAGENIPLISAIQQHTSMDSVFNVSCKPGFIELVFRQPMRCNSISADGSDFLITGPQNVTAIPFVTTCNSEGLTNIIRLNLTSAIIPGIYQLSLKTGTDGNTLLNECLVSTPANSTVSFTVSESVNASFTNTNNASCSQDKIEFFHTGANNVNSWNWNFGNGNNSAVPNPVVSFSSGNYMVRLIVSNGVCTDTSVQTIRISDEFNAAFYTPAMICPGDMLQLKDRSTGNVNKWNWNFGNGVTSNLQDPLPFRYTDNGNDAFYTMTLIIENTALGCRDTVSHVIKKLKNCLIAVPNAFTPNGDGKNDYLYPLNALKADNLEFKVYNRIGQLIFYTRDWTRKWNGKVNGVLQDPGIYAWLLSFIDRDTGEKVFMKGTSLLLK